MVFGEKRYHKKRGKRKRKWYFGEREVEETATYMHVGVKLSSNNSSKERTREQCNKGKGMLAGLSAVGVRSTALNPIISSQLWETVCIPSMLHGSELWCNLTSTEVDGLEKTQKLAAKCIQGLPMRTHDEVARGLLGWVNVKSLIHLKKMAFLRQLINAPIGTLARQIFIRRLYEFVFQTSDTMKGFLPDIAIILDHYDLYSYLEEYVTESSFPSKAAWKAITKRSVFEHYAHVARARLSLKGDVPRYTRVHGGNNPFVLYKIAKTNVLYKSNLCNLARILALPCNDTYIDCDLCGITYIDCVDHYIMQCPMLNDKRDKLWDMITDVVGVHVAACLFHKSESEVLDIFLGKRWELVDLDVNMAQAFICAVSVGIKGILL